MRNYSDSMTLGGRLLTLEVGYLAEQANMAVLARYGDTMVLVTVVSSKPREDLDYFPLHVEYVERLYAGGKIKGSRWVKREGRPSDEAILKARLIDRSIRPLFPQGYKNEVQVIITILSVDGENDPDVLSVIAASCALHLSDIPWNGPIGCVRIGFIPENDEQKQKGNNYIVNPSNGELEYSEMNLVFSGTSQKVVMLEADANEIEEKKMVGAIELGSGEIKKIIELIKDLRKKVGKKKQSFVEKVLPDKLLKRIKKEYQKKLLSFVLKKSEKQEEEEELSLFTDELVEKYGAAYEKKQIVEVFDHLFKQSLREQALIEQKRIDGRKPEEIRPIEIKAGVLPRTHGSVVFKRGKTQTLTVVTLASPSLKQLIESPAGEETKRYMHHYYMPPFSVGETGRLGWPSRREVGHGALAERALLPVIPSEEKFPYTIRVVSEILSSNGSTSMAAVCGSTLSLMDAGVPIKEPVAGLSLGLITGEKKHIILSDIAGVEDFSGDMDFKVAGTKNGITAIQLDVKTDGLSIELIKEVFEKAKKGRTHILKKMLTVLSLPRVEISKFAPKVKILRLPTEKIGEVIGPGGKIIRKMIAETGASIDIEDDGTVNISSPDKASLDRVVAWIEGLTKEVKVGEVFEGTVKRILPFGAFIEIFSGKEGLVHVSQMARRYIRSPEEIVSISQKVKVRVKEIDEHGRINLSMLFEEPAKPLGHFRKGLHSTSRRSY